MELVRYLTQEELHDNFYKFANMSFQVKVAWMDLMDMDELQRYGYVSSGDPDEDRYSANEKITVSLTIPKLLDFYRKRKPFYLTNKSHEHTIYSIIHQHLFDWRQYAEDNRGLALNLNKVPYQDLKDLADMASMIYAVRDRTKDIKSEMKHMKDIFEVEGLLTAQDLWIDKKSEEKAEEKAPHLAESSALDHIFIHRR